MRMRLSARWILRACGPMGIALLLAGFATSTSPGAVLYVYPDGSGDYPDIQSAIVAAENHDTIALMDGVFEGPGNRELHLYQKSLTFTSVSGSAESCVVSLDGRPFFHLLNTVETHVWSMTWRMARFSPMEDAGIDFQFCNFDRCEGIVDGSGGMGFSFCSFVNASGPQTNGGDVELYFCNISGATSTRALFSGGRMQAIGSVFLENATSSLVNMHHIYVTECRFLGNRGTDALLREDRQGGWMWCELSTFARNEGTSILFSGSTASIVSCTFADNTGAGPELAFVASDDLLQFSLQNSILSFRDGGPAVTCEGTVAPESRCSDIFGNSGGDWNGCLAAWEGVNGNISADPLYCRVPGENAYLLRDDSPCLPGYCSLMGAWGQGCAAAGVAESPAAGTPFLSCRPNP
ncbi:MAG: hypothetical protein QUU85_10415, partial [Candidatus Eisenbacteria bacterium]|nr:hypothetical protein [Candidatus Eisenbacteria bacterium]